MRVLSGVLACALVLACARDAAPASAFAPLTAAEVRAIMSAPDRHIRAVDEAMNEALANGMRRSGTFAHLVLALNKSDVIVYIETGRVAAVHDRRPAAARRRSRGDALPPHSGQRPPRIERHDRARRPRASARARSGRIARRPRRGQPDRVVRTDRTSRARDTHQYDTLAAQDAGRQVRRNSRDNRRLRLRVTP